MAKKRRNKQLTPKRHVDEVQKAYDHLEVIALRTAEKTLKEVYGFGDVRMKRFRDAYLWNFGEQAAEYADEIIQNTGSRDF
jgi:hypothetical protein